LYNAGMTNPDPLPMSRQAIREVDRIAILEFGIPGIVLMENAGRGAAQVVLEMLKEPADSVVAIVCGAGNNGGDGFVIARHLHNAGVKVAVYLAVDPAKLGGDAKINCDIAHRMKLPIHPLLTPAQIEEGGAAMGRADVIVDAILGTGFSGQVRPPFDEIIRRVNALKGPKVVAVDLPSGLDCDTGQPSNATIRADVTVTFVAPKVGFGTPEAAEYVGRVVVVDIGDPRELVGRRPPG